MYQIVKFLFPFADDFAKGKSRPSLVISPSFSKHKHVILAYITTDTENILDTDLVLDLSNPDFQATGLRSLSIVRLHRIITVAPSQIGEVIGVLPTEFIPDIKQRLIKVFQLDNLK